VGNTCVYDTDYESWMTLPGYINGQLFDTEDECCAQHACDDTATPSQETPSDVVTYIENEDFENGLETTLPWIHGGSTAHVSDWHVTSTKSTSGTHSLRSGDLNNKRGKSSDVSLKVDSSMGATVSFSYYSSVGFPFDFFDFKVCNGVGSCNGVGDKLKHRDSFPINEWKTYEVELEPGEHVLLFRYWSPGDNVPRERNANTDGSGVVYIDELKFLPATSRRR
jgi:hypothetical protein